MKTSIQQKASLSCTTQPRNYFSLFPKVLLGPLSLLILTLFSQSILASTISDDKNTPLPFPNCTSLTPCVPLNSEGHSVYDFVTLTPTLWDSRYIFLVKLPSQLCSLAGVPSPCVVSSSVRDVVDLTTGKGRFEGTAYVLDPKPNPLFPNPAPLAWPANGLGLPTAGADPLIRIGGVVVKSWPITGTLNFGTGPSDPNLGRICVDYRLKHKSKTQYMTQHGMYDPPIPAPAFPVGIYPHALPAALGGFGDVNAAPGSFGPGTADLIKGFSAGFPPAKHYVLDESEPRNAKGCDYSNTPRIPDDHDKD